MQVRPVTAAIRATLSDPGFFGAAHWVINDIRRQYRGITEWRALFINEPVTPKSIAFPSRGPHWIMQQLPWA